MLGNKPPYTTMQQLNLDWILSKLKTILRLVPDDGAVGQILRRTRDGAVWSDEQGGGGGGAVQSVNGKTGAVVLDASDVGALPDDYTPPVTSVNGQTGAVVIPTVTPLDAYPVGSIYMSVNSTSPATLFGGTWEQLENRFLLGAGSDYTAGATGGEAAHTLTVDEMPSHNHLSANVNPFVRAGSSGDQWPLLVSQGIDDPTDYNNHTTNTGGGQAHNNMPPYLAVYMWKRTA